MEVWIDSKETAASTWGDDGDGDGDPAPETPVTPVFERAVATSPPVQYEDGAFVTPTASGFESTTASVGGYARLEFNCGVTRPGQLKLTARGYRWDGDESVGNAMRFESQLTRPAPPTDGVPFDTYDRWVRIQRGRVVGFEPGDEYIDFRPSDSSVEEWRDPVAWETRWDCIGLRLAELELVRNAPFARYVLQERGEWDDVRGTLRWKPSAFGGPDD